MSKATAKPATDKWNTGPAEPAKPAAKKATTSQSTDKPIEREEYTAKQIATRINTDAKTLRKFFRSSASTVEPVGQGGRYNFDAADLPKIREEFEKWNTNKKPRGAGFKKKAAATVDAIEDDSETLELDEDIEEDEELEFEDPTDDDLEELEDDLSEFDDIEEDD